MRRHFIILLALLVPLWFVLSGCGGSGGEQVALSGTVTDVAGNLVPGADIKLDGQTVTRSLANGTYKIATLAPGDHNIEADAWINTNELWTGTRAVTVYSDGPTMNQNVVIGHWNNLGTISGIVTDASSHALANARVIAVARYPQDRPAADANVISKVVVVDSTGHYSIPDLPASITVNGTAQNIVYDVIASSVGLSGQPKGFDNVTKSATVGPSAVTTLDFTLTSSSSVVPTVPSGWTSSGAIDVISYTVPTSITSRAAQSAFDAVKSSISVRSRKIVALEHKVTSRAPSVGTLIENDVIWFNIWTSAFSFTPPVNLAGFSIYRATETQPTQNGTDRIDFFRDPSILTYADTSATLSPGINYYYGVSAVSTSYLDANNQFNPLAESAMSASASVSPLDKLMAAGPADGASVNIGSALFNWLPAFGAQSYRVFVYSDYPILDSMFTPQGDIERPDHLPSWGQTDAGGSTSVFFSDSSFPLQSGHTYWWVVMGGNTSNFDNANAYSISELRSFVAR